MSILCKPFAEWIFLLKSRGDQLLPLGEEAVFFLNPPVDAQQGSCALAVTYIQCRLG